MNEVLNLAMLTGNKQVYPLWIYKVSDVGMVAEVTSTTACHSVENDIMKVCINLHIHVLILNHDTLRQHAHSRTVVHVLHIEYNLCTYIFKNTSVHAIQCGLYVHTAGFVINYCTLVRDY